MTLKIHKILSVSGSTQGIYSIFLLSVYLFSSFKALQLFYLPNIFKYMAELIFIYSGDIEIFLATLTYHIFWTIRHIRPKDVPRFQRRKIEKKKPCSTAVPPQPSKPGKLHSDYKTHPGDRGRWRRDRWKQSPLPLNTSETPS